MLASSLADSDTMKASCIILYLLGKFDLTTYIINGLRALCNATEEDLCY